MTLKAAFELATNARTGKLAVKVTPRSSIVQDRELLVCAVLREDGVVTKVESGENAKKTLTARFPARATKFEYIDVQKQGRENPGLRV